MSLATASRRDSNAGAALNAPARAHDPRPDTAAGDRSPGAEPGPHAYRLALHRPPAEAPLELGAVDDPQEREAEAAADRVMRTPEGNGRPFSPTAAPGAAVGGGGGGGDGVQAFLAASRGEPLAPEARTFMEPRFGRGFADVRVHTGPAAARSAQAIGAAAYTVGRDLVFGAGRYRPGTASGRRLLAHELAHVAQQSGAVRRRVQRVSIYSYNDSDPQHDPSRLSDGAIQATDEYRYFSTYVIGSNLPPYATPQEALLAVRLLLRWLREGKSTIPYTDEWVAQEFIDRAKRQLGALGGAEALVGNLAWVPFNSGQAVSNPAVMQSDFARWLLAGAPEPSAVSGSINCWEMVLFGGYRAGQTTFARLQQIYGRAVANVSAGTAGSVGDTVETELRGPNAIHTFTPGDPDSPAPLAGDLVIFNEARVHAAIGTGTVTSTGDHEVISLWSQPNNVSTVQRTTIEAILAVARGATPVRFWSVRW
jgi:hypothetical protein